MLRQKAVAAMKGGVPFFIGAIMGLIGQTLVPMLFKPMEDTYWDMSVLISNMDIYPFLIVFMIYKGDKSPKIVFKRIFLYFLGLCVGYYMWTTILGLQNAVESGHSDAFYYTFISDLADGLVYSVVGFFAALWGCVMARLKGKGRMAAYYVMTVPFIIVEVLCADFSLACEPPRVMMALVDVICLAGIMVFMVKVRKEFSDNDTAADSRQEN